MLGAVIGDIAGSRFEFDNYRHTDFDIFSPDSDFTDDTICTGASEALGQQVASTFSHSPALLVIFVVAAFIIFLTEFTSNTASAALLVPIFASIATQMGLPEQVLVFVIGIGASCAFMLPVATPPNAIVFGTGLIKQREMMNVGLLLNVLCIVLVALWAYFVLMP